MAITARWPASALACFAISAAAVVSGCGDDEPKSESVVLPWTLIDVGKDGQSLRVQNLGATGGCDSDPAAEATSTSPTEIRITVTKRTPVGKNIACPAIAYTPKTITVKLGQAVDGQRIDGPKYMPNEAVHAAAKTGSCARSDARRRPLMCNVVGLRLTDARRVLRAVGVTKPSVVGEKTKDAVVRDQRPEAAAPLAQRLTRSNQKPNQAELATTR